MAGWAGSARTVPADSFKIPLWFDPLAFHFISLRAYHCHSLPPQQVSKVRTAQVNKSICDASWERCLLNELGSEPSLTCELQSRVAHLHEDHSVYYLNRSHYCPSAVQHNSCEMDISSQVNNVWLLYSNGLRITWFSFLSLDCSLFSQNNWGIFMECVVEGGEGRE